MQEACISFPNISVEVERALTVTVEYLDLEGQPQRLEADGLMAHCIQHETDHLNGILFIDHAKDIKEELPPK